MKRAYTQTRRAEQQAQTRHRIAAAAVELHASVGPAHTTIRMVAERAGVQRHTVYAHFPDEMSLLHACSGLAIDRDPLPDAGPWKAIENRRTRLGTGLADVYGWYARNENLASCVLRDAEHHAPTRQIVALRLTPWLRACHAVLGRALTARQRAILWLALGFFTWRALVREGGLGQKAAVDAMAQAVEAAGRPQGSESG